MSDKNRSLLDNPQSFVYCIVHFLRGDDNIIAYPETESSQTLLLQIIAHHGLTGHILEHKNFFHLDPSLKRAIKRLYLTISVRNTQLFETYKLISDAFKLHNIEFIPLKGAFLLPTIYGDIAARNISDIDVLIRPADYDRCKAILIEMGAVQFIDESESFLQNLGHQYAPYWLFNTSIELHNRILSLNLRYAIPVEDVWSNLIEYPIEPSVTRGIEPNLLIIYLAMHIHYSEMRGEYRVYWYMDIAKMLERIKQVDMATILNIADHYGNKKPLLNILSKVAYLFNIEIEGVKKLSCKEMDLFLENLSQLEQSANKGYSIALERVLYTKGFKNKLRFIKQSIASGSDSSIVGFYKRFLSIGKRLLRYFIKRH